MKKEEICFLVHETNRNKCETDLVSVCFDSNRNLFLFVSRTPYIGLYLRTLGKGGEGQVKGGDGSVLSPVCAGKVGQKCSTHTDGLWVIWGPGFSHLTLSVLFY
jgi:hypothetical protein